jgi:hypothetical protein
VVLVGNDKARALEEQMMSCAKRVRGIIRDSRLRNASFCLPLSPVRVELRVVVTRCRLDTYSARTSMSSFSALRDKRKARQGASFTSTSISVSTSSDVAASANAEFETPPVAVVALPVEETTVYARGEGMYNQLPDFLEIRVSKKRGRGIYVKEGRSVKAGPSLRPHLKPVHRDLP